MFGVRRSNPWARAIAFQQLHEKAAESILKRFIALFPGRRWMKEAGFRKSYVEPLAGADSMVLGIK